MRIRLVLAAALCGVADIAVAQSFECAKAHTRVEKMVCADRAIAELDEHLGRYYAAARAEIPGAVGPACNPIRRSGSSRRVTPAPTARV